MKNKNLLFLGIPILLYILLKNKKTHKIGLPKYEYKVTDCADSRDCQIEIDALTDNGFKPWSKLTQAEKKRYFRLKRRQEKFITLGK
jgi:hypothetical protein